MPLMNSILKRVRAIVSACMTWLSGVWRRYRGLRGRYQIAIAIGLIILIIGIFFLLRGAGSTTGTESNLRTVTLETVASLSGNSTGTSILGTVRSLTEAELLAQAGGAVTAVHTQVGAQVPAGFVIAELENSTEAASVLQAQGAYEAAVAGSQTVSPEQVQVSARNTYRAAYATLDTALKTYVDTVFGGPTAYGPLLVIDSASIDPTTFSKRRQELRNKMDEWNSGLATANSRDGGTLLLEANTITTGASAFLDDLTAAANDRNSGATADQRAALVTARSSVNTLLATLAAAEGTYKSQSQANAGGNASVKQALGSLRLAQSAFEKKVIRAPISGTVNFLPVRPGDYVTTLEHVATVAQNGALEIVATVTEENRASLTVGTNVTVDGTYHGVVTSIAPALDPVTKQIEVRVAVEGANQLVNGQSVRIALPAPQGVTASSVVEAGPVLLPLSTVKLTSGARVVFTTNSDNRLVAIPVTIGQVRGDRIEITSTLATDTRIVSDARGLSEGERVSVVTSTAL